MPEIITRPETDNLETLLKRDAEGGGRRRDSGNKRKSLCLKIVGVLFLFFLILIPLIVLLWWNYGSRQETKNRQSPINILPSHTKFDQSLADVQYTFDYKSDDVGQIKNTGHGWKIGLKSNTNSTLRATHLPGTYRLVQLHTHWDTGPTNGSEHVVNGVGYAAEIHFVHYNLKYETFSNSLKYKDGLAVLGVFVYEDDKGEDNENLKVIVSHMKDIEYKNESVQLESMDYENILPDNRKEFWSYEGSLTTPPFSECVIWTVFRHPIPISSRQEGCNYNFKTCLKTDNFDLCICSDLHKEITTDLAGKLKEFRTLKTTVNPRDQDEEENVKHDHKNQNYVRSVQLLSGRTVKSSFHWEGRGKLR